MTGCDVDTHHPAESRVYRWMRNLSLDRLVIAAAASRIWQFIAGPVTVVLIVRYLSDTEQGFFYAFAGYLGLQAFFELGLSSVLISIAGHEMAEVESSDPQVALRGSERLGDLIRRAQRWYTVCAAAFAIVAGVSGWLFFSRQSADVAWHGAWSVLVVIASLNLWLTPRLAILEGCGHAYEVYVFRWLQAIAGNVAVWAGLVAGAGLYVAVISAAMQLAFQSYLVWGRHGAFFRRFSAIPSAGRSLLWSESVLPMQWRIAIQGIALYLATQSFTLVLMETQDARVAGRWGMTWSVLFAIQSVAMAWIVASFPKATRLAAAKEWLQLRRQWWRVTVVSTLVLAVGIASLAGLLHLLEVSGYELAERFIDSKEVVIFGVGMLAYHLTAAQGFFVRAHRRESLYWAATSGQLLIAVGCWYAGAQGGVEWLCIAYAVTATGVLLPLHTAALVIDQRSEQRVDKRGRGRE